MSIESDILYQHYIRSQFVKREVGVGGWFGLQGRLSYVLHCLNAQLFYLIQTGS